MQDEYKAVNRADTVFGLSPAGGVVLLVCVLLAGVIGIGLFQRLTAEPEEHIPLTARDGAHYGAEGSDPSMLVIRDKKGKYGYGDARGNILIKPQFDQAEPFFEGLAAVKKGWRWGYIDMAGKTVIPFRYYDAGDFHNGRAFVGSGLRKPDPDTSPVVESRLIDTAGQTIRETPQYRGIFYLDGITMAQHGSFIDYLDADYNEIITGVHWSEALRYYEGIRRQAEGTDGGKQLYSYISLTGKTVAGGFTEAQDFSNGFAAVKTGSLWGYIDRTGKLAIKPAFTGAFPFGEGMALAKADGAWAVIDETGKVMAPVRGEFDIAKAFHEGLCAVGVRRTEVERHAKEKADGVSQYTELADQSYWWGFVDVSGRLAVECKYDAVSPFVNGIAEVILDGKIGYIDKTGKYVWELQ